MQANQQTSIARFTIALEQNAEEFDVELTTPAIERLQSYYALILKWNERLHLVGPCSPEEFATRHVLESLLLRRHLPTNASVADIGSGGGLPIIPCLIVRPDIRATLVESSQKKAVFLREALRTISAPESAQVAATRFEEIGAPAVEFITSRALDRFSEMLPRLVDWAPPAAKFLIYGGEVLSEKLHSLFSESRAERIPRSDRRFLIVARKG